MLIKAVGTLHDRLIFQRRIQVLSQMIGKLLPESGTVLDIGAGDGQIATLLKKIRPGIEVEGIDVYVRGETHVPVHEFDGLHIPLDDKSVDAAIFVDVLHHADDPQQLLREARRVSREAVIIKDHLSENALDFAVLRAMDWVGNAPHGVVLPYNYKSSAEWNRQFQASGLRIDTYETRVPLYPVPLSFVFGRKLHFIARLRPTA
ncbi:MAG TPA: methyltransferase domain-containing protein [Mesorhizobium sp.]|nr:methyltransferase domain-containing protein [Mesorhizobium sp.]